MLMNTEHSCDWGGFQPLLLPWQSEIWDKWCWWVMKRTQPHHEGDDNRTAKMMTGHAAKDLIWSKEEKLQESWRESERSDEWWNEQSLAVKVMTGHAAKDLIWFEEEITGELKREWERLSEDWGTSHGLRVREIKRGTNYGWDLRDWEEKLQIYSSRVQNNWRRNFERGRTKNERDLDSRVQFCYFFNFSIYIYGFNDKNYIKINYIRVWVPDLQVHLKPDPDPEICGLSKTYPDFG